MKTKIADILERETITPDEARALVRAVGDALKKVEQDPALTAEDISASAKRLADMMDEIEGQYDAVYVRLKELDSGAEGAADALYDRQRKFRTDMIEKINALPPLPPVDVPYGIERLVEIAGRLKDLTDDQWARMVDLARALAG